MVTIIIHAKLEVSSIKIGFRKLRVRWLPNPKKNGGHLGFWWPSWIFGQKITKIKLTLDDLQNDI